MKRFSLTPLSLAISGAVLLSFDLHAQTPSPTPAPDSTGVEKIEAVVVTGTNIRGARLIGGSVQALNAEEIARTGKASIAELLRELPANLAGGVAGGDNNRGGQDTTAATANLTGGTGVNLRGLGALSTLVLVNGRRVAASGQFGDFVDISNIPVAAIERLEVLKDGASAVYGSDAVGGVVNIILKRYVQGVDALVRVGDTTQGGGRETQVSLVGGSAWEGGNFIAGWEFNSRDRVSAGKRNFNGGNFTDRGGVNWPAYTSRAGRSANIFTAGAAFNGNVAFTVPAGAGTGLTVSQLLPAAGGFGNSFDPWQDADILPKSERNSLFLAAQHEINEKLSINGSARFTSRKVDTRNGYLAIFGSLPNTNPAFIPGTSNNFGVLLDDNVVPRTGKVTSTAAEIGMAYDISSNWNLDAKLSFSQEKQERATNLLRDSNIVERLPNGAAAPSSLTCSLSGLNPSNIGSIAAATPAQVYCASLNYATFNPYSSAPLSAQVLAQIYGSEVLKFDSTVAQGTLKLDGKLLKMPAGEIRLATGLDYRVEAIDGSLNYNYRSINPQAIAYGETEQKVASIFGELAIPLVKGGGAGLHRLDLSLAARHERSSGLKDFQTSNPKMGLRYEPVNGFALTASAGTSFHAPPMRFQYDGPQPSNGGNAIFYANAFYTAPCNTTLVRLNGFSGTPGAATGSCTFTGMIVAGGAGPILKPERAKTYTLGLDIAPAGTGFKANMSYFNLAIRDRLVRISPTTIGGILANYFATGTSPFINSLVFNPSLELTTRLFNDPRFLGLAGPGPQRSPGDIGGIIYATQTNLAALKTNGIDIALDYDVPLTSAGKLKLFGNGTWVRNYRVQGTPRDAFEEKVNLYESTGNPVSFKSRQGATWTAGPLVLTGALNYVGSYKCMAGCFVPSATGAPVPNTSPIRIGSWTTLDLNVRYELGKVSKRLGNSALTLSVLNAFDKAPPFIDTGRIASGNAAEPYDSSNATIVGRGVALTFTNSF
jgi:iron complex outermembrane recepter protein